MSDPGRTESESPFIEHLRTRLGARLQSLATGSGGATIEVAPEHWLEVARMLRDDAEFRFEQLIDLCGVDYLGFGRAEWDVSDVSSEGFSRGVEEGTVGWLR